MILSEREKAVGEKEPAGKGKVWCSCKDLGCGAGKGVPEILAS